MRSVTKTSWATALFVSPWATSLATRSSVAGELTVAGCATADAGELGARTFSAQIAAPRVVEDRECLVEGFACGALHPRSPSRRAEDEKRAGTLEWNRYAVVLDERRLEGGEALVMTATGRLSSPRHRPTAASADGRSSFRAGFSSRDRSASAGGDRGGSAPRSRPGTKRMAPGSRTPAASSGSRRVACGGQLQPDFPARSSRKPSAEDASSVPNIHLSAENLARFLAAARASSTCPR